jgi:hypothetical protein
MLFGIYWLFFRFIIFFLFFVNRTDDGASFCIASSLLLRFFALWIVNHDFHLEIGCMLSLPQFRKGSITPNDARVRSRHPIIHERGAL